MSNTYIRFINMMLAVKEATPEWPALDAVEDRILLLLAAEWNSNQPVSVLDVTTMDKSLSASTVHRRLGTLLSKGVINLEQSTTDGRYKLITPTQLTLDYFSKLSIGLKKL